MHAEQHHVTDVAGIRMAARYGSTVHDQLLIATFDTRTVRVVVAASLGGTGRFDDDTVPYPVHLAVGAFAQHRDPLHAVTAANTALRDSCTDLALCVAWVDVRCDVGRLVIDTAGRCGTGDVTTTESSGSTSALLEMPMWRPEIAAAWRQWMASEQPGDDELAAAYTEQARHRDDHLCPPLGLFDDPEPDTHPAAPLAAGTLVHINTTSRTHRGPRAGAAATLSVAPR